MNRQLDRRTVLSTAGCGVVTSLAGCTDILSTDPISVEWETNVPRARSSFTVDEGMVYLGTRNGLYIVDGESGDNKGQNHHSGEDIYGPPSVEDRVAYYGTVGGNTVYRTDDTGNQQWSTELPESVISCALGDEMVYAATGVYGDSFGLFALEAETGDDVWSVDLDDYPVTSSPAVYGERVLLQSGGVAAFDSDSGDLDWRYERDPGSIYQAPTRRPIANGSLVYCTDADRPGLFIVDLESGNLVWETGSDTSFTAPTVRDDIAYVGAPGGSADREEAPLYAFDAETEEEVWSTAIGQSSAFGADTTNEFVYSTGGSGHDTLYALKRSSGEIEWEYEFNHSISQPVVDNDRIYVAGDHGMDTSLFGLTIE